jgi:hypothetical protein
MEIEIKHSPSTSILGATWIFQDSKFIVCYLQVIV